MITKKTITSAKLVKHLDIDCKTVKDSVSVLINGVFEVPFDPANTDYQQYLLWVAEGNTPEAAD
tara:strand:- start:91 stop:282 length:192 start_codon:yes stop_codon:yes gene_type:complete